MEEKKTRERKNQYTCSSFDRELNAIRTIEERTPQFEYAGGFTHCDGSVLLRCKKCGNLQWRSMISIRKKVVGCDTCRSIEALNKEKERAADKEQRRVIREERHEAFVARKATEAREKAERKEQRRHQCPICGKETTNRICCSKECGEKRHNQIKEAKRRAKIADAFVDRGITIQALYKRDNGICYLCGGLCDWNDKENRENGIVCGNLYPSIDHVVPLAHGGRHEWDNVRLAHRICNSKKQDFIPPWVQAT